MTGETDVIALDFSKAFDKVPLHNYGIRGPLFSNMDEVFPLCSA